MMTKLKERIMAMDSKKEERITRFLLGYCVIIIACIIFTSITKKFETTCDIMRYIGYCVMLIWIVILGIRKKSKEIVMRNNIVNIILSDYNTVFWGSYLIIITILQSIRFEISSDISMSLIILAIIIVISIEIISENVNQYFNKKLK